MPPRSSMDRITVNQLAVGVAIYRTKAPVFMLLLTSSTAFHHTVHSPRENCYRTNNHWSLFFVNLLSCFDDLSFSPSYSPVEQLFLALVILNRDYYYRYSCYGIDMNFHDRRRHLVVVAVVAVVASRRRRPHQIVVVVVHDSAATPAVWTVS